ncbi:MAG: PPXXXP-CTERM sorting domain-containing protein, partial [Methanohalobium sp.]
TGEYGDITVSDEDPSHYFGISPTIDIEKSTNGEDADDPTGPEVPVGDEVDWVYNVTNTGNVDLSDVTVTDNQTGEEFVIGDLASGESTEVSDNGTAQEGQYANLGNVTGEYGDITVSDEDPSHYLGEVPFEPNPGIDIEKSTNGEDADTPTGPEIEVGGTVTWTYNVTNTGNVPLNNVQVNDSVSGVNPVYQSGDTNDDGVLQLNETWTYEAIGTAEEGQYENIGNVTGDYEEEMVSDEDLSHYKGIPKDVPTASPMITAGLLGAVLVLYLKRNRNQ